MQYHLVLIHCGHLVTRLFEILDLLIVQTMVASTVSFYVTFGYTVTYAKQVLKLPVSESFMVQMIAAVVMLIVTPIAGALSDRYDRKTLLVASLGAYLRTNLTYYTLRLLLPAFYEIVRLHYAPSRHTYKT